MFARVSSKRNSPWIGALLGFLLAALLLPIGDLKILAELSSFVALLAFFVVNLTLVVLRFRLPEHPRPFRVPFHIGRLPLLPVIAMMSIVLLLANFDLQVYLAGAVILALICIGFFWRPSRAACGFTGH
jgi:APA family basic amino acid/polyamine antiporter